MNARRAYTGTLLLLAAASTGLAQEPDTVVLRGDELQIWPAGNLIERGFEVATIPRDENAAWVYIEAANAYVDLPKELETTFNDTLQSAWCSDDAKLAEYLDLPGNRRCMELARKGSVMKRHQMPYFGDPAQSAIAVMLPNLSYLRFISKLMVVDGKRLEAQGQYDRATDNYTAVMRMGMHTAEGATVIESLVGIAMWNFADRAAVDMALRRPLSRKQLCRLLDKLNKDADRVPTARHGVTSERVFGLSCVDELCSRPLRLMPNLRCIGGYCGGGSVEVNPVPHDGWGKLELRVGQLMLPDRAIKRHMKDYYDKVVEMASAAPHRANQFAFDEDQYVTKEIPRWDVISRMLVPALSRAIQIGNRSLAQSALTRTSIALRLYMLKHEGESPAGLHEIESDLPEGAMLDPFSGDLLLYRPVEDGWLLYSIGPNLIDDGGQTHKQWDRLDLVRRYPPQPFRGKDADAHKDG